MNTAAMWDVILKVLLSTHNTGKFKHFLHFHEGYIIFTQQIGLVIIKDPSSEYWWRVSDHISVTFSPTCMTSTLQWHIRVLDIRGNQWHLRGTDDGRRWMLQVSDSQRYFVRDRQGMNFEYAAVRTWGERRHGLCGEMWGVETWSSSLYSIN